MVVARVAAHDILLGVGLPIFALVEEAKPTGFQSTGLQSASRLLVLAHQHDGRQKIEENVQVRQTKYRDGMKVGHVCVAYVLHFTCVATMP